MSEENSYRTTGIINIFLALWLISNPFTFASVTNIEKINDIVVGVLISAFSALMLIKKIWWLRWVNALLGSWLIFSPLAFWTSSDAIYSNDSLLGGIITLVSAYTASKEAEVTTDLPQGWTYNPSSWSQRLPIMYLAFIGFLMARYLAAFQLGHIPNAWDPFFGNGTERILTSDISKAFPVSDAGLGAMSYLLDVIAAAIGDKQRWKTMPWMVILFGLFIIPTGVTSITLVMLQPIGVGAWCSICLFTAFIMLIMVPPSVDEVCASVQFLRRRVRAGKSFWQVFWNGDVDDTQQIQTQETEPGQFPYHLLAALIIGCAFFFLPNVLDFEGAAANNIYISGSLVATFAVIAFAQVARITRFLNVLMGIWLIQSVWWLGEMSLEAKWMTGLMSFMLLILSLPRGKIAQHFGSLDGLVRLRVRDLINE